MSRELALDLGTVIAYLVPGFLGVLAVSYWQADLRELLLAALSAQAGIGSAFLLAIVSLAIGMIVSVVRGSTLDWTLRLNLRKLVPVLFEHYSPIEQVHPNFSALANADVLEAYREAGAKYQRPYQFYGNLIVVGFLLVLARMPFVARVAGAKAASHWCLELLAFFLLSASLYTAYRRSYWRYAHAVTELNCVRRAAA